MTATSAPRNEGGNWTMGLYHSATNRLIQLSRDPIHLHLPSTLQCRMQTRLMKIGTDIENWETVTTDHRGRIPAQYQDFLVVFSKVNAKTHKLHRMTNNPIDQEPGYKLPYGGIFNLSEFKLKMLKAYIEIDVVRCFIQRSSSPAAATMHLCKWEKERTMVVVKAYAHVWPRRKVYQ